MYVCIYCSICFIESYFKKNTKMSYLCNISCHIDVNVLAEKFSSFDKHGMLGRQTQAGPTSPCGGASDNGGVNE